MDHYDRYNDGYDYDPRDYHNHDYRDQHHRRHHGHVNGYYDHHDYDHRPPPPPPPPVNGDSFTREDYDEAVRRNLHVWTQWRTEVNDTLIKDIFTGHGRNMRPLDVAIHEPSAFDDPDDRKNIEDPHTLMNYSIGYNKATNLDEDEFLQYGIPRAHINMKNMDYRTLFPPDREGDSQRSSVEHHRGRPLVYVEERVVMRSPSPRRRHDEYLIRKLPPGAQNGYLH